MTPRLEQELELLRHHYGDTDFDGGSGWFQIRAYPYPQPCQPVLAPIIFQVSPAFPGANPYGFAIPSGTTFDGRPFSGSPPPSSPPYSGTWLFLSWQPDDWIATADLLTGSNLWGWARGFAARLKEGP
jgi:hypothetical protein